MSKTTFSNLYNQTSQKTPPSQQTPALAAVTQSIYGKSYPRFSCFLLPPASPLNFPLGKALIERQSLRKNISQGIPNIKQLSSLFFYGAGIKSLPNKERSFPRRTYPSGGGRYPLEIYLYLRKPIRPLDSGVYHYQVQIHALERLPIMCDDQILKKEIFGSVNGYWLKDCWGAIFVSAVFQRTEIKYGSASFRYIFLEGGHLMQNIYLATTALKLGCCSLGGFEDKKINNLLSLDTKKEVVIYCANLVA